MLREEIEVSENENLKGQCLCGRVSVVVSWVSGEVGACHCGTCRRWGGGPYLSLSGGNRVRFDGEKDIAVYASSEWAERGFCRRCGTHLFYRLQENQHHYLPAGLFPGTGGQMTHQVFIDEKPDYYDFSNATRNLTGAEVLALFGAD